MLDKHQKVRKIRLASIQAEDGSTLVSKHNAKVIKEQGYIPIAIVADNNSVYASYYIKVFYKKEDITNTLFYHLFTGLTYSYHGEGSRGLADFINESCDYMDYSIIELLVTNLIQSNYNFKIAFEPCIIRGIITIANFKSCATEGAIWRQPNTNKSIVIGKENYKTILNLLRVWKDRERNGKENVR